VVNHESVSPVMMFPAYERTRPTPEQVQIEMAAHGLSIVEIRCDGPAWQVMRPSPYARLITRADPTGRRVIGTLNNCAGAVTPWGAVLSAEENFHGYFTGNPDRSSEAVNHARYRIAEKPYFRWSLTDARFNVEEEPNEPNRFGWVVEIDPYNPQSAPKKRTALKRFAHEGASTALNHDGPFAVYSSDDWVFEYVYRFVSERKVDPDNRGANRGLLDRGTLSVARFDASGDLCWLPLV
jgi:secreted PhoX family phosphatase